MTHAEVCGKSALVRRRREFAKHCFASTPARGYAEPREVPNRKQRIPIGERHVAAFLLVFAVLLAYGNSLQGSFQFDDYAVIVDNPAVASWAAWWQSMPGIRPVLKLSYALNRQMPEAWLLAGFHAVNVALHIGNVLLLHALAKRLTVPGALLAALLFAVHPINTEAVSLISGRSMTLMSLFYLASIVLFLDRRITLSLLAWGLALAVRETALTLPLALLLIDRQRVATSGVTDSASWRNLRPYLWVGSAALLLMAALPRYRQLAEVSFNARPLLDNLISQCAAVIYLLRQWLWPLALNADPVLPAFHGWTVFWLASVAACLGAVCWAAWVTWRGPALAASSGAASGVGWLAFAVLWFALHLAPTNSLLPRLDLANERHLYLAGMGICLCFGWAGAQLWGRWRGAVVLLLGGLFLALAVLTQQRNRVYYNEVSFWSDVTQKSPGNARAWNNLGYAWVLDGKPAAAFSAYARALELQPEDFLARLNQRALCREHAAESRDESRELRRLCGGLAEP